MTTATPAAKLDLTKQHPEYFRATEKPAQINVGRALFLTLASREPDEAEGHGDFKGDIDLLYALADELRTRLKDRGQDFKLPPLEAQWWPSGCFGDHLRDLDRLTHGCWRWKLMLMVPAYVTPEDVEQAKKEHSLESGRPDGDRVQLEHLDERLCVQVLHTGPYADVPLSVAKLREAMRCDGLRACGRHHEIYLNDPTRAAPERMRIILRQPVRREHAYTRECEEY